MSQQVRIAVFRPDDERLVEAIELLESLGATPIADPMLAIEPTGTLPTGEAEYTILTSKTGVELAAEGGWEPGETTLVSIGPGTTRAAEAVGWTVDREPDVYSSTGLVDLLADEVEGRSVELARSDHGSDVLLEGLEAANAEWSETILYELIRPPESGRSAELAAADELEAAAFTSSLTVQHFLEAAADRGIRTEAIAGLENAVVGVIGEPTRETAESYGLDVDIVPDDATFAALATAVVEAAAPSYTE